MGAGLRRVAKAHGGLTISAGGEQAHFVPVEGPGADYESHARGLREGWHYAGLDDGGEFYVFTKPAKREGDGVTPAPVPMALRCPECGAPHVDEGEWEARPHKTHQCQACGHEWRPFPYATVGVAVRREAA